MLANISIFCFLLWFGFIFSWLSISNLYKLHQSIFYIVWERMAHKKAAGSVKNLKDSQPKYRGVKVFGGQPVLAGNIIIRQKGTKYECGKNTYESADFSVHAAIDGVVSFRKKNFKKFNGRTYLKTVVDVLSVEELANQSVEKAPEAPKAEKKPAAKKAPAKKAAPKKEKAE